MGGAGDYDYERGGDGYARARRTDPRIAALVHGALGTARSVVNVGAGAGSYEPTDRAVVALEPSAAMRRQRPPGAAPVLDGVAEHLPFPDDALDAAMAMVTVHQWRDAAAGIRELRRVARDTVVILTFDGDALHRFWLADYAPELIEAERRRYPAPGAIAALLGPGASVTTVPVARDCVDGFTEAYYARPEAFLVEANRRAQSAWRFVDRDVEDAFVERLGSDLESGAWDAAHGPLRRQEYFEGSLRLVVHRPAAASWFDVSA